MRAFRVRLVAHQHRAAGPRTCALADSGVITPGLSTELCDYLETARLNHDQRSDVADLWSHVEMLGPEGTKTLRQLDDEEKAAAYALRREVLRVERQWRESQVAS